MLDLKNRVRVAIEDAGLSQRAVAKSCRVSAQAVSQWLKSGNISRENLVKLHDATRADLRWLLTGEGSLRGNAVADGDEQLYSEAARTAAREATCKKLETMSAEDVDLIGKIIDRINRHP